MLIAHGEKTRGVPNATWFDLPTVVSSMLSRNNATKTMTRTSLLDERHLAIHSVQLQPQVAKHDWK